MRDWLDKYLESIIVDNNPLDWEREAALFDELFGLIANTFDSSAFVKYRNGQPMGALAPAYFEAVTMGLLDTFERAIRLDPDKLRSTIAAALESEDFRSQTGPGANSRPKLNRRIELIAEAVNGA